ncbi:MAG: hypothetical protein ABFE01_20705 [Phycisphaerales bacterium]
MASAAQVQANRSNSQKSTGPRTAEGKERASQNAVKHGLLAREAVIVGEDPAEFEMSREGMLQTLAAVGPVEAMLAERIVGLSWRLKRAERLQNAAFAALEEGERTELLEARLEEWKQHKGSERDRDVYGALDENAALAKAVVEDFADARVLDRLLMYERRIESSLYRAMAELRKEREARMAAESKEAAPSQDDVPAGQEPAAPPKLASFGATAKPEEVASVKCQVSSDRSDFTLQTSHFELPGSHFKLLKEKITPHGVTTNQEGPATQSPAETLHDSSGETKPIVEEGPTCLMCDDRP